MNSLGSSFVETPRLSTLDIQTSLVNLQATPDISSVTINVVPSNTSFTKPATEGYSSVVSSTKPVRASPTFETSTAIQNTPMKIQSSSEVMNTKRFSTQNSSTPTVTMYSSSIIKQNSSTATKISPTKTQSSSSVITQNFSTSKQSTSTRTESSFPLTTTSICMTTSTNEPTRATEKTTNAVKVNVLGLNITTGMFWHL